MGNGDLNWIANYIWGIADDVLRDLYVRGKYRDVILPMTVLRRLDAVLEDGKQAVLDMKATLDAGRRGGAGRGAAPSGGAGLLQRLAVHLARPASPREPATARGRLPRLARRVLPQRAGHPRQLRVPQPDPAPLQGRRARHADREAHLARHQPEPRAGDERRRQRAPSRPRQSRHGHDLRGAGAPLQRGEQRGGGRALDPARRRAVDGEARLPAHRGQDRVRHLPALRRRLRHRRHADRGRGDPAGARRRAPQAGLHPPLRPGDQRRDLRHLQGRPPAQGRGRGRRQHRGRAGAFHARQRRLPVPRVRLHALQPALRQELEDRPGAHGRKEGHARPPLRRSSMATIRDSPWSPAPATARCCSSPTSSPR